MSEETLTNLPAVYVSLEDSKKQELKKLSPLEKELSVIKEKHKGKAIKDLNDKEGYMECKEAVADFRSYRSICEKARKDHKDYYRQMGIAIDAGYNSLYEDAEKEENGYKNQVKKFEEEVERIKLEKKQKQEADLFRRQLQLTKMGAQFDGTNFVLEGVEVNMALVREVDDETYEAQILPQFKEIFDRNESIRIAEEEKKKEADRILREQQAELERQKEAIRKQQEELTRKQNEIKEKEEAAQKKKENDRIMVLHSLGMTYFHPQNSYVYKDANAGIIDIKTLNDEDWDNLLKKLSDRIDSIKEDEKIEADKKIEASKQKAIQDALEKQKREQDEAKAAKEEQEELARIRKQEELEQSTDAVKWAAFLKTVPDGIGNFEFKSPKYRKKSVMAIEKLQEIKSL